jgi:hypothetical protein
MERSRPAAVQVIGILHLIIGGLGVLCLLGSLATAGGGMMAFQKAEQKKQMEEFQRALETKAPAYGAYKAVCEIIIPMLLTAALIVGGIGLLQMKPWSRPLSIGYALTSMFHKLAVGVYSILFLLPIMSDLAKTMIPDDPNMNPQARAQAVSIMETSMSVGMLASPCVSMIYPVAVLIVMGLPSVRQAFGDVPPVESDGGYSAGSTDIRPKEY